MNADRRSGLQRAGRDHDGAVPDEEPAESPAALPKRSLLRTIRGAGREFSDDNLTDTAAALTYYAVQALFPGALVLLSIIGLLSKNATQTLFDNLGHIIPGTAQDTVVQAIKNAQANRSAAGIAFFVGLIAGIWSASGYVAAFMRASNVVYDVPEGRPIWKTLPTRVATTVVLLILMVVAAVIVVFSGPVAEQAGNLFGLGHTTLVVWSIAKWPVLLLLMMVIVGILYWASPNVRQGYKWVSPGGVVGVLIWIVASALFALYVANFSSYSKSYGTFAAVIIFLVWIWISNLAILLGAEINAELLRSRAEADGLPEGAEPYVELRDTRKLDADEKAEVEASRLHRAPMRGGDSGAARDDDPSDENPE